jgi:hypothetical protein
VENGNPSIAGADGVTFRNVSATLFYITGRVSNIAVIGGSYGPALDAKPQVKPYNTSDNAGPSSVLMDGVLFHDYTRSSTAIHTECLQVYGVHTLTIRRSKFTNCDGTASLAVGTIGTWGVRDAVIENNWLDSKGDAPYAIQGNTDAVNVVWRYNSALKPFTLGACTGCAVTVQVIGNYMPWNSASCVTGVQYDHNVFQGGTCGASDLNVATLDFVDAAGFNLHLRAGANALDRGSPTVYPSSDFDGLSRPRGAAPDAGANELG